MVTSQYRHGLMRYLIIGVVSALASGCGEARARPSSAATAPGLRDGDMVRVAHNVANPNGPFSIPSPRLAQRPQLLDVNAVPPCDPSALSVFESRAEVNGMHHAVRFSLANGGQACRLGGFPSITLLRADGTVIGGVRIRKISADTMRASLTAPSTVHADANLDAPSPQVLLAAKEEAAFELGWTSGPRCESVSRIAMAAPGSTVSMQVSHAINVCENQVLLTAVAPSDPR